MKDPEPSTPTKMCVNATLPVSHPLYAYQGEGWVDDMLAIINATPRRALQAPVAREGSLWLSVSTKRRAAVLWASTTHARLAFSDHGTTVVTAEQLTRLYTPIV